MGRSIEREWRGRNPGKDWKGPRGNSGLVVSARIGDFTALETTASTFSFDAKIVPSQKVAAFAIDLASVVGARVEAAQHIDPMADRF